MSPSSRAVWLAATLAALVAFAPTPAAFAKRHSIAASARHHNFLVFKLEDIAPPSVRSARLRMGGHARRMSVRTVRAAARRGTLRARVPKRWRRSSRSSHSTRTAGSSTRAQRHLPKLVLMISSSVPSEPTTVTPSAPPPSPPAPLPVGAKFVSASGSDSDPGTESAPWRTIAKAVSAAQPGDTVVFRAGTYGARGTTTTADTSGTAAAPITFTGYPGQPNPMILGHFKITGSHLNFKGFLFNGPTGDVGGNAGCTEHPGENVLVRIAGSNVTITNSEVRNSYGNAGIYVSSTSGAEGIEINRNWIHDNGGFGVCGTTLENGQHGIYWHRGEGRIYDNVIEHNWTRGVQLYSDAHDVRVEYNHIVWNGRAGVIQGGSSSDNVVSDNIVAGNAWNGQCGIYDYNGAALLVTRNVLWHNHEDNTCGDGMTRSANITADPLFVGADVDSPPAPLRVDRRWTVEEAGSVDFDLKAGSPAVDAPDRS